MKPLDAHRKEQAIDMLKMLDGLPPYHDGGNICRGDGYFANAIERQFGMPLTELRKVTGYDKIAKKIGKLLKQASEIK